MVAECYRRCTLALLCCLALPAALAGDPTMPPGWAQPAVPATTRGEPVVLTLQQVLIRGGSAVAVINNQLVRTGDYVDGAKVVAISASSVRVKIRQQERELSLLTDTEKFQSR